MAITFQLFEYPATDITRTTSSASYDLNDGTITRLAPGWNPSVAGHDIPSDTYTDVIENIEIMPVNSASYSSKRDVLVTLGQWARKCQLNQMAGGQAGQVWVKYGPESAASSVFARVYDLNVAPGAGPSLSLQFRRQGLWEGSYRAINTSNLFNSAASTTTIHNHMDRLTHVYDYNNNGAGAPFTGGSYSTDKPTYILANAINAASGAITETSDGAYFGCTDGAFYGFKVNISAAASYVGTFVWQYYSTSASTWSTLVCNDGTSAFTTTGEQSVTWTAASTSGWGATTVNSVSAYWVRMRCNSFTSGTRPATISSSAGTYFGVSTNWLTSHMNYVKVDSTSIVGDVPAPLQIMIQSKNTAAQVHRVAKRTIGTVTTGTNFVSEAANSTTALATASEGNRASTTPGATAASGNQSITLNTHNYGVWRVLVGNMAVTVASTARYQLKAQLGTSGATLFTSDEVVTPATNDQWLATDIGIINIAPALGNSPTNVVITPLYYRTTGTEAIREDNMWILPLDEFYHVAESTYNSTSYKLILSGLDNRVFVGSAAYGGTVYEECDPLGQSLTLEPGKDNYFFFLNDRANYVSANTDTYDVTFYYVPRFWTIRGST